MRTNLQLLLLVLSSALFFSASCSTPAKPTPPPQEARGAASSTVPGDVAGPVAAPKRIIYMIGDGMGVSALSAATYAKGAPLSMLGMAEMGLATTHSYEFATTDSAASATALASGAKTHYQAVGVKAGTTVDDEEDPANHLQTMLEKAQSVGWKTGLVATVRINHATPGSFAGHRWERHRYEEIALDMSGVKADVMIGGGRRYFDGRGDQQDLIAALADQGFTIVDALEDVPEAAKTAERLIALSQSSDLPRADDPARPLSLEDMTLAALEILDRNNDAGFFLMVEGSQIDWGGHAMDGENVVVETLDFDAAIRSALAYAAGRDDTLVVVTADHETGGLSVLDSAQARRMLKELGGAEAARASVARSAAAEAKYPSATLLPEIKVGAHGDAAQTADFGGLRALSQREDAVMRPSFGHLSVASRGICESTGRFGATHTSAMVPIFAQGAGAAWVAESRDNAVLGARIMALIGAQTVPALTHSDAAQQAHARDQKPTNIVLMIGGGMGVGALTAAYYAHGPLQMGAMPVQGLVAAHGLDHLVNDCAAAATALATGQRTRAGAVGVVPAGDQLLPQPSVLELAEQAGMRTGIITTGALTGATPAAFYAHVAARGQTADITQALGTLAERVPQSDGVDLVYAGGAADFRAADLEKLRETYGIEVRTHWDHEPLAADKKVMRLLADHAMLPAATRRQDGDPATPTLAQMTTRALAHLSGAPSGNGFFLVIEGAQIDTAQHQLLRDRTLVDEVLDFDEAVGAALDFARQDGNTLLLVTATADHTTSVVDNHYGHNSCQRAASAEFGGPYSLQYIPVADAALGPDCQPITTRNYPIARPGSEDGAIKATNKGMSADKTAENAQNGENAACHGSKSLRAALQGDYAPPQFSIQYGWEVEAAQQQSAAKTNAKESAKEDAKIIGPHSANFVPFFAFGPGSARLQTFLDQPELGQRLRAFVAQPSP